MYLINISTCDSLRHELLVGRNDQDYTFNSHDSDSKYALIYPLITLTMDSFRADFKRKKKKLNEL